MKRYQRRPLTTLIKFICCIVTQAVSRCGILNSEKFSELAEDLPHLRGGDAFALAHLVTRYRLNYIAKYKNIFQVLSQWER